MERVQIYLDEDLNRKLASLSHRLRASKASLIRDGVRLLLRERGKVSDDPLMSLKGAAGRSRKRDVSERHDAYLYGRPSGRGRKA